MLDLFEELRAVIACLDAEAIAYALCGGLAMAVHGFPRATVDIDLVIPAGELARLEAAVRPLGFTMPALPMTFRGGAARSGACRRSTRPVRSCRSTCCS